MGNRIAAILVGIAVMFSLELWASARWYFALVLGAVAYGIVRYAGYFARERRYMKRTMEEAEEAVRRGRNAR
jgi:hypothetical protein